MRYFLPDYITVTGGCFSLIGCGICGFAVGIMWPGTFSIASDIMRKGGTALFALLALAGDLGCGGGPTIVGTIADITKKVSAREYCAE